MKKIVQKLYTNSKLFFDWFSKDESIPFLSLNLQKKKKKKEKKIVNKLVSTKSICDNFNFSFFSETEKINWGSNDGQTSLSWHANGFISKKKKIFFLPSGRESEINLIYLFVLFLFMFKNTEEYSKFLIRFYCIHRN